MSGLDPGPVPLIPAPSVRDIIARNPLQYRARLSLAIECANAMTYAPTIAALALLRSLIAQDAACRYDAQVFAAELALRLRFGPVARALTENMSSKSRFHRDAIAAMRTAAAALPAEMPQVISSVERIVAEVRSATASWHGTIVAGGPTAALLVALDPRPWHYGLDIPEALPLATAYAGNFACMEAHVPLDVAMHALLPLFEARVPRIVAVLGAAESPLGRRGYRCIARRFTVEGTIVSLGDGAAWSLLLDHAVSPGGPAHTLDLVEWQKQ